MFKRLFITLLLLVPTTVHAECVCSTETPLTLEILNAFPNPSDGEEWITLLNTGDQTIELSLYTLEDSTANPWTLNGTINPGSEKQITDFPFQLNNGGDSIVLKTLSGVWLDTLTFESSSSDQIVDGNESTPEPKTETEIPVTPEFWPEFSEALPNPEGSDNTDEWIELYNPYDFSLELTGLYLDDADGGSSSFALEGSLAPESYKAFWIEDTKLTLNNGEDHVRLLGSKEEILWDIPYSNSSEGSSYAAFSDFYDWTQSPTPGEANILSSEEAENESEYNNGDLSEDVEITEVYPNPEGPDQDGEWIEITNGGDETVNLGNWVLDDGPGGSEPYILPDDFVIEPGETIIIERTESGLALNNSDEIVQISDFNGEVIDEVQYEETEEGMSYSQIEVEEVNNEQASSTLLGQRNFTTWEWVKPSPGETNPSWKQFKGTVESFEGNLLTLFDGLSHWSLKVEEQNTNALVFQIGNELLVRSVLKEGAYHLMYSELLQSKETPIQRQFPWEMLILVASATTWLGYEYIKRKRSIFPSSQPLNLS